MKFGIALLILLGCGVAAAEPVVEVSPAASEALVVGVENIDHYPHYRLEQGEWQGLGRDLLDAFSAYSGYRFVYRPYPVKRLMQEHMAGGVDFRFPDNPLWSAEQRSSVKVHYSDPFLEVVEGTLVRPERRGLGVAKLHALGTIIGFTAASYRDLIARQQVQVEESSDSFNLMQKAIRGRIDGAYLSIDSARHILDEVLKAPDALVFDAGLPYDRYQYLLSSTTRPDVIAAFNRFLREEPEQVEALIERYRIYRLPPQR